MEVRKFSLSNKWKGNLKSPKTQTTIHHCEISERQQQKMTLTLYGCFITIYLFTPLKSRQKRFCYHLDLPIHKTHGFAYHILLYLTYFRFCILGVLQQKLDHLQFSEVQNMLPPPMGMETELLSSVSSYVCLPRQQDWEQQCGASKPWRKVSFHSPSRLLTLS